MQQAKGEIMEIAFSYLIDFDLVQKYKNLVSVKIPTKKNLPGRLQVNHLFAETVYFFPSLISLA
jgi:hypothetical protein